MRPDYSMKRDQLLFPSGLFALAIALTLLFTKLLPLTEAQQTSQTYDAPTPSTLVGLWKVCYEPGLKNVQEIDGGYLVFSPDGTFMRVSIDYLEEGKLVILGTWHITGTSVYFKPTRQFMLVKGEYDYSNSPGPLNTWTMAYKQNRVVALFDSPLKPAKHAVLIWRNANYGFAKTY